MSRYADSLLTEGEVVVLRTRQHWLALLVRARAGVLLFLLGILTLIAVAWFGDFFDDQPALSNIVSGIAAILMVLGVLIFLYRMWHWWAQDYIVTNRRLLKVTGILNKRSGDSSLEKINDAVLMQSLWGRMLNYGDLEILTAADTANDYYRMLNAPKDFKKTMLTQKHQLESGYMFQAPPSPPMRASSAPEPQAAQQPQMAPQGMSPAAMAPAPTGGMTPPPVAAAPPPAPDAEVAEPVTASSGLSPEVADEDESLEVTQTLARLADLRDAGAITAEEYEEKKDELLGRL